MPTPETLRRWQAAEQQLQAHQVDAAIASYRALLDDPELAPLVRLRLSLVASLQGRYRDAVDEALAAFAARNEDPDLLEMLAKRLAALGETEAALACATAPSVLATDQIPTAAELGKLLSDNAFPEQALTLLRRAQALGLDTTVLRYLIGLNLVYTGDEARAQRVLEGALEDDAAAPMVLWSLAKLRRPPGDGVDRVERLRDAIARGVGAADGQTALLHYALFHELDARDETEAAWAALEAGMDVRRRQLRYDGEAEQALFDHLGGLGPVDAAGHVTDGPRPVFIVGMPRSGTTLLDRMLGNHPGIANAGELGDLVRQLRWCADLPGGRQLDLALARKAGDAVDWATLGRRYLAHTQWRANGRRVYTDKLPSNFLSVGYILRAMPQARILHMVRGPMDSCFSSLKEWFAGAYPHSYDQLEMADHFRRYRALMAHWHAAFPGKILDVRYDELVVEPERVVAEVLAFIGLPAQDGMSDIVAREGTIATASAAQLREPVHQRFVGQWKRYETRLAPLKQRLGVLGY